jgi:hypothetical protein
MIAEGYGARPFCDLALDTDKADFGAASARLESETRRLMAASIGRFPSMHEPASRDCSCR